MGERKVVNKYYPPDFDPAKIQSQRRRQQKPKNEQKKVRTMLPMSIRCRTCGNYIYKGTKFNSRQEYVIGEKYLVIKILRFYIKCTKCSSEITFKTDPKNADYVVELGASRNFEPWRAEDEEKKMKRNAEDDMKSLENRTLDSKREMVILAALDEMISINSRHATVSVDAMLEALQQSNVAKKRKLEEEDEALIKSLFNGPREQRIRIDDEEDSFDQSADRLTISTNPTDSLNSSNSRQGSGGKFIFKSSSALVSITKKPRPCSNSNKPAKAEASSGLQSLCQQYGSDEED